jgi:hypothetical protein
MTTNIKQAAVNKLAHAMTSLAIELDRLEDVASNAALAIDRANAGASAHDLKQQLVILDAVLDNLNFS